MIGQAAAGQCSWSFASEVESELHECCVNLHVQFARPRLNDNDHSHRECPSVRGVQVAGARKVSVATEAEALTLFFEVSRVSHGVKHCLAGCCICVKV